MIPFAVTLPHLKPHEMFVLEVGFKLYALVSFLGVASYGAVRLQKGQLIQNENSPLPFTVPGVSGWLLIASVIILLFLQSALYMILAVMGVGLFTLWSGRTPEEQFGLRRLSIFKIVMWSLLICGAVIFVEKPLIDLVEEILNAIQLPHPEQESVETFKQLNQPVLIFGFMLQAVVLSPFIEELFFRGFLLTFLRRYTSTLGAILLSAGVFAFAHVNLDSVIPLWFLGVVLGIVYQHTGSLWVPLGVHACWNFFTAVGLLLDKGNG